MPDMELGGVSNFELSQLWLFSQHPLGLGHHLGPECLHKVGLTIGAISAQSRARRTTHALNATFNLLCYALSAQ